ncbi:NUDIX domain-containing protein [Spongiibacter sp. KMU-158]|uniref:ADP-ribose pyrophosphatase n=1 Tax=Spongiibacter pelagi TaxID=2760804 RepID=A0A927GWS4_9GAMM|nr:NUDIX domain-containing protein [Spongiibacter pelagi]MBD2858709.1 NUDIX domain-containing protein [Spongiibacter pelagi]
MAKFSHDDVEIIHDRIAWQGFFKVRELRFRHRLYAGGWSQEIQRELFARGSAVGLLPYDPVNDLILQVEQIRVGAMEHPKSPWIAELVAGIIDKAESPEEVARREAEEEAGLVIGQIEKVAEYYSSPGGTNEYFHLYCGAADLSQAGGVFGLPEEGEDIRAAVLSYEQAMQALASGEINNAHSIIALQWLSLNRARLREAWSV